MEISVQDLTLNNNLSVANNSSLNTVVCNSIVTDEMTCNELNLNGISILNYIDSVNSDVTLLSQNIASFSSKADISYVDTSIANLLNADSQILQTLTDISGILATEGNNISSILTLVGTKANDDAVIHLNGNETVNGAKQFNGNLTINGNITTNAVTITPTELSRLTGVSSNVQTQLNNHTTSINNLAPEQVSVSSSQSITTARRNNCQFIITGSNDVLLTLPSANTTQLGKTYHFFNQSTKDVIIAGSGSNIKGETAPDTYTFSSTYTLKTNQYVAITFATGIYYASPSTYMTTTLKQGMDSLNSSTSALQTKTTNMSYNSGTTTFTGTVAGITKAMVGLGNVDNTSDMNKPISTATQQALNNLDGSVEILQSSLISTNSALGLLQTSTDHVTDKLTNVSYNPNNNTTTFTGTVAGITKSMVGLGNVDNTSDLNKPISTATQTALTKLDTSLNQVITKTTRMSYNSSSNTTTFTGTVAGITKTMVGLGNVDNTSDLNKPISNATRLAFEAVDADIEELTTNIDTRFNGYPVTIGGIEGYYKLGTLTGGVGAGGRVKIRILGGNEYTQNTSCGAEYTIISSINNNAINGALNINGSYTMIGETPEFISNIVWIQNSSSSYTLYANFEAYCNSSLYYETYNCSFEPSVTYFGTLQPTTVPKLQLTTAKGFRLGNVSQNASGYVGIDTQYPSCKLHVNGTFKADTIYNGPFLQYPVIARCACVWNGTTMVLYNDYNIQSVTRLNVGYYGIKLSNEANDALFNVSGDYIRFPQVSSGAYSTRVHRGRDVGQLTYPFLIDLQGGGASPQNQDHMFYFLLM